MRANNEVLAAIASELREGPYHLKVEVRGDCLRGLARLRARVASGRFRYTECVAFEITMDKADGNLVIQCGLRVQKVELAAPDAIDKLLAAIDSPWKLPCDMRASSSR